MGKYNSFRKTHKITANNSLRLEYVSEYINYFAIIILKSSCCFYSVNRNLILSTK